MRTEIEEIVVEGKRYVPAESLKEIEGDVKIVILQRGWVMIGVLEREGSECKLHNASVIRTWGTKNGLGELANGKLPETKLDKCYGLVEFDWLTVVATISADGEKWKKEL